MFWKSKKKAETPDPNAARIEKLAAAAADPGGWMTLDKEVLLLLAFMLLTRYGTTRDDSMQPTLRFLYQVLVARLTPQDRLRLEQSVSEFAEQGRTGELALLPFLLADPDLSVVTTAAIDYAMTMPRENGDPLTGPKFLVERYEASEGNDHLRLGLLMGLLYLGDDRLAPLLMGRWRDFSDEEDRRNLASASPNMASTLLVSFLVDWLEHTDDDGDVGAIAGAMTSLRYSADPNGVIRMRRCFPASDAGPDGVMQLVEQWSFAEYAALIRHQLAPLIAKEAPPKVIPEILEHWCN